MADVVVLTKNAPEITMGQENGSRAVLPHERGFFTKVGEGARDHQVGSSLTVTQLSLQPVNAALPGTEPALPKDLGQRLQPLCKIPCAGKFDIGGDKGHFKNSFLTQTGITLIIIRYWRELWN
jgi:hypothetical protein